MFVTKARLYLTDEDPGVAQRGAGEEGATAPGTAVE